MGVFYVHEKQKRRSSVTYHESASSRLRSETLLFYKLFPVSYLPTKCISLLFPSSMKYNKEDQYTKEDL